MPDRHILRWHVSKKDSRPLSLPDRPDWGYSGWVELPDGSVYAVQYITADAPATKPFIRGYLIPRSSLTSGFQK